MTHAQSSPIIDCRGYRRESRLCMDGRPERSSTNESQSLPTLGPLQSPLPRYQSCEFQNILVYIWLSAAVLAAIWPLVELLRLKTFLCVILLVYFLTVTKPWIFRCLRSLEPTHIIALGLIIALVGVIWQWRKTPAPDSSNHCPAVQNHRLGTQTSRCSQTQKATYAIRSDSFGSRDERLFTSHCA